MPAVGTEPETNTTPCAHWKPPTQTIWWLCPHASTLNLVWVKSSRLVSAPGCSSRWLLWPGWAEPAAHSLLHHPSPQVQVISAQLPAAGKHIIPFLHFFLSDLPAMAVFNISATRAASAQQLPGICAQVGSACTPRLLITPAAGARDQQLKVTLSLYPSVSNLI